jgi:SAM-dependent methyltransferase
MRRCSGAPELLDQRAYAHLDELRGNLADMARYGRWLGAFALARRLLAMLPARRLALGVDLGCGSGEFIASIRSTDIARCWVGVDLSEDVLRIASGQRSAVAFLCADAGRLPLADVSADVIVGLHILHHFDPPLAVDLLRECRRIARACAVFVDLSRSAFVLSAAWLLTRLTSRNRLTRSDSVLSVRRAYTVAEAAHLAQQAGWEHVRARQHGPFYYSLTLLASSSSA